MTTYNLKLKATGTKEEIADALRELADAIHHETSMGHGMNLSDETLEIWDNGTAGTYVWEPLIFDDQETTEP